MPVATRSSIGSTNSIDVASSVGGNVTGNVGDNIAGNIGGNNVGQRRGAPPTPPMPCRFRLYRHVDATGVSGVGTVAWGTVYPNGKVSLAWCGTRPSINVYESLADVEAIHGHDGRTRIIMCDEPLPSGPPQPDGFGW